MRSQRFLCGLLWLLSTTTGCPGGSETGPEERSQDLAARDLACIENPRTHIEILNACTNAQSVDKKPVLPLLRADGTLPPLP